MKARIDSPPRGFTLLEMLVVLILAGLVTGILLQGLNQVFRLQTQVGRELFQTQQGEMHVEWFRQSINGTVPDYEEGKHKFKGAARELSGLTLSPLESAAETLLPYAWRLKFDPQSGRTLLRYGTADDAPVVLSWPGNSGRFVYYDAENVAHDDWPPFLGKWPQLPRAVYLENQRADEPKIIVAVPKGLADPLPRHTEID